MIRSAVATLAVTAGLAATPAVVAPATPAATTPAPSTLTCTVSNDEIRAGASLTVATQLKVNTVAIEGAHVELWVQEYPATGFSFAMEAVTNASGSASFLVAPTKRTVYKWKFNGDPATAASTAQCTPVKVHTKVTMRLRDEFISPGQTMVAKGTTTPAKPGATVTIFRTTISNRTSKWFSGTVHSDGTYRLARTVKTNLKYTLYVVVAASSGNLAGKSPSRDLYVS